MRRLEVSGAVGVKGLTYTKLKINSKVMSKMSHHKKKHNWYMT